jgi:hypothetical protein
LAIHGRPKALLSEMPVGLDAATSSCVSAAGLKMLFTNAALFAVYSITRPSRMLTWPPAEAKCAGIITAAPFGSIDSTEPGA